MREWLRRLWAELKRDHVAEHARAVELYKRRLDSPEKSPEAVRPESRKSK